MACCNGLFKGSEGFTPFLKSPPAVLYRGPRLYGRETSVKATWSLKQAQYNGEPLCGYKRHVPLRGVLHAKINPKP